MTSQPWLMPTWRVLSEALQSHRVHHALLLAGPKGQGKRVLADAFAAAALCSNRAQDGGACGACKSCLLVAAGSHPDLVRVTLELRDDGKPRSEITVDQLRNLCQRLSLSSQFGGLQIALIDPADAMNASAANALLKTLEEPATNTVIVLIADDPSRLPATIRSRCQRVDLRLPTREEALEWLRGQGVDADDAALTLEASLGNPGQAAAWIEDGTLALRAECIADLAALAAQKTQASIVAERWAADRPESRLWFASVLAREEARRLTRGERGTFGLTARGEIPKLAAWFGRANRARSLLSTPLRTELILLDLLRGWPGSERTSRRA
jgi:DNA polymerase-3 subunit delta'